MDGDVVEDAEGENGDDAEREDVSKREECGEDGLSHPVTVVQTFGAVTEHLDLVWEDDGDVEEEHEGPDDDDGGDDVGAGAEADRACVVHDRHVSDDRDQDEGVDCRVSGHVDQVVHQLADHIPERELGSGELVGREGRDDQDEEEVSDRQVQQQQVGHCAHALTWHDDVDDKGVPHESCYRDETEGERDCYLIEDDVESVEDVATFHLASTFQLASIFQPFPGGSRVVWIRQLDLILSAVLSHWIISAGVVG